MISGGSGGMWWIQVNSEVEAVLDVYILGSQQVQFDRQCDHLNFPIDSSVTSATNSKAYESICLKYQCHKCFSWCWYIQYSKVFNIKWPQ